MARRPAKRTRPLRVLHVAGELAPNGGGGIGVIVDELAARLAAKGISVTVAVPHPTDTGGARPWNPAYEVTELALGVRVLGNPISFGNGPALRKLAAAHDVIHAHSHLFLPSLLAQRAARRTNRPFVLTSHGLESQTAPRWLNRLWLATVGKRMFRDADAVIALKPGDRARIVALGAKPERVHVIANGVDAVAFHPMPGGAATDLLFVGRLAPHKGAHHLVAALRILRARGRPATLSIVGRGPRLASLRKQAARAGLPVTFHAGLSQRELAQAYSAARVFALPSASEGLPMTMLEALACGTPVVVHTSLDGVAPGASWSAPYGDRTALANALEAALDAAGPALRRKARKLALREFTPGRMADAHAAVYRALATAARRSS